MTALELLLLTVDQTLDKLEVALDDPTQRLDASHIYNRLARAVDAYRRSQQGLPPEPLNGRPAGSLDKQPRKPRA